jgi:outer membrane lipoprotein carrier protein
VAISLENCHSSSQFATDPNRRHAGEHSNTMSKRIFIRHLVLVLALMAQGQILAQAGPGRVELENFALGLQTLQANFTQQVVSNNGAVENVSSGEVWLKRPQLFRWEYGGDFPEVVVADGSRVWLYDEMLEQVTVKSQSSLSSDSPLILLTDIKRLDEQFEARELGDDNGMYLLELLARNEEAEFERVLLGLQDGSLLLMAMEDAFGLRTEIRFQNIQRNPELDQALFHFEVPADTDVIGDLPGGSED